MPTNTRESGLETLIVNWLVSGVMIGKVDVCGVVMPEYVPLDNEDFTEDES